MANRQENLSRRYLLGQLPESEQEALEARFFADADWLEEMWAAENRLVDDYVRDRLPRTEREQFESYYLDSSPHRERVAAARMLLQKADEAAPTNKASVNQPAAVFAWWTNLKATFNHPALAFSLAVATLILTLGTLWLLNERARLRDQLAQRTVVPESQPPSTQALEQQLAQQREQNAQLEAELAQLRAQENSPDKPSSIPAQPATISFVLTPFLRGEQMRALTIPPGTRQVRLQMKIESDDYQSYHVSVSEVGGAQIWQSPARKMASAKTIYVNAPASKLSPGDYILALSGRQAAGEAEAINRYYFRVSPK